MPDMGNEVNFGQGEEETVPLTVPGGVVLLVELLLDVGCDVLLDVVLLECLCGAVDGVLLHLLGHVRVLDDGLALRHLAAELETESCCCK